MRNDLATLEHPLAGLLLADGQFPAVSVCGIRFLICDDEEDEAQEQQRKSSQRGHCRSSLKLSEARWDVAISTLGGVSRRAATAAKFVLYEGSLGDPH